MKFCTSCGKQLTEGQACNCSSSTTANIDKTTTVDRGVIREGANIKFCISCGKQLAESHACDCNTGITANIGKAVTTDKAAIWQLLESIKNRMGIGDPERNATDTYERGMKITPDCIRANENEIPVRQYNVAVLRNLLRLERAEGRIQVTNKRVIFRAAGRSIGGRTTLQQEFAIDEIAGLEAARGYRFSFFHLVCGFLVFAITTFISSSLFTHSGLAVAESGFFKLIFGYGGFVLFFLLNRKFLLKLLLLGASYGVLSVYKSLLLLRFKHSPFSFLSIFAPRDFFDLVLLLVIVFGVFLYTMRPDFAITIKNKGALDQSPPIRIRRNRGFWKWRQDNGAGFSEVMPTPESERAIREIGAIINDIQKLGDLGVEKWVK